MTRASRPPVVVVLKTTGTTDSGHVDDDLARELRIETRSSIGEIVALLARQRVVSTFSEQPIIPLERQFDVGERVAEQPVRPRSPDEDVLAQRRAVEAVTAK